MPSRFWGGPLNAEYHNLSAFPQLLPIGGRPVLGFDDSTDQEISWSDVAAQGLAGPYTLVVFFFMASATSGAVRWQAQLEAITPNVDTLDLDATTSFATANSNGATVPGTAGYLAAVSITMTNDDSIAPGDYYRVLLRRDADGTSGTDDATGLAYVTQVELRDSA
jgi:hypothetical protein